LKLLALLFFYFEYLIYRLQQVPDNIRVFLSSSFTEIPYSFAIPYLVLANTSLITSVSKSLPSTIGYSYSVIFGDGLYATIVSFSMTSFHFFLTAAMGTLFSSLQV
jgi:hypothetical protein